MYDVQNDERDIIIINTYWQRYFNCGDDPRAIGGFTGGGQLVLPAGVTVLIEVVCTDY